MISSDYTAFPNIYKHSYWGNNRVELEEEIIQARNDFIQDYEIVSYYDGTSRYLIEDPTGFDYDHKEYYRDKQGRVVQVYSQQENSGFDPTFTKIAPMYNSMQFTAIKIVETIKSRNKRKRTSE
jgi:hypothetical protein